MKKFFRRCTLPFLLFLTAQGCYFVNDEQNNDLLTANSDEVANQLGSTRAEGELPEDGIKSYDGDIFNLTHKVINHWNLLPNYEVNKNGGFILHLDGYNGDLEVAKTNVKGSKSFEQISKLVFSLGGLNGQDVEVQIKIANKVVRENTFNVKNNEKDFELFIGGLDLKEDFEVIIKLCDDVTYSGDLVVRDIHFSAALLEGKDSPYVYNDEKELSLLRDSARHWEVNHGTDKKYDDKLVLKVKEGDSESLFARTTVIGSDKLRKFKSLIIEAKAVNNNTSCYNVKIVIGGDEHVYPLSYSSSTIQTFSLENIDPTKDFDIYFYPAVGESIDMTVEISNLYLTSYSAAPLDVDGTLQTFDAMENAFYHWSLEKDSGEELVFHDDGTFEVDVTSNSSSDLAIINKFNGIVSGDYNKAILRVKGPAGNVIKISPVFYENYSYYPDYYFTYDLTGEEQEIIINYNDYRVNGISIYPCIDQNNQPGKIEVLAVNYYESDDNFNLANVINKVGNNSIDITQDIIDYWQYNGNNVSIDENGIVTYDLSAGDEQLSIKLRRSHALDNTEYSNIVFNIIADSRFNTKCTTRGSSSSGYYDVIPNVVQRLSSSLDGSDDFGSSNFKFDFYKYSSNTPTIKILSVKLVKEITSLTGTDYQNVAKDFDDRWASTLDYTLVDEKAKFEVPNNGLTYFNYVRYRPSEQIKFNQATLQFDALEKPLTLSLKLDSHTCSEEQTLPAGTTSSTFTLTPPGGNWYTYSDYKIGFLVKNNSDAKTNFRLTSYSLTKV